MAGTPEGAAKATAKRLAKAAERRAAKAQSTTSTSDDESNDDGSIVLDGSMNALPGHNELVELARVNLAAILRKKDRGSLTARGNLSIRLLELDASMKKAGARSAEEAAALGALALLRRAAAGAESVPILPAGAGNGGEYVGPLTLPHTPQQPERQSDASPQSDTSAPSP